MLSILVVDDERGVRLFFEEFLKDRYDVDTAEDGVKAINKLQNKNYDLVFLDLRMPNVGGFEVLDYISSKKISKDDPPYVVVLTAIDDIEVVVSAIKKGAYDYIVKPININRVEITLSQVYNLVNRYREIENLKRSNLGFVQFVGKSKAAIEVLEKVEVASKNDVNVLVYGESGVGKEIVAKLIHYKSSRGSNNFVTVDCSSIPESLIESELFGYEKGAFTGAFSRKIGKIEYANKGTIFLDVVGNIPINVQAKLLRVIQEKSFSRIGSNEIINVDVRFISATNVDLKKLVSEGKFREDLFFRINVLPIYIPPLRERKDDIPLLLEYFTEKYSYIHGKKIKFSDKAIEKMMDYPFYGNVRELQNIVLRYLVMLPDGAVVDDVVFENEKFELSFPRDYSLDELKDVYIEFVLNKVDNNVNKAAKILGISRRSLYNWMKRKGKK
ncbi:MAG: sigma-54-dependent transcriptional regulator [Brevinematia bacterium]